MKLTDEVRIINGKHRGKTGVVVGRYQAQGLERLKDEDFSGLWYIEFEDGTQDIIHESLLEVI